tara:strand:- start:1836 stop:2531 length:696 start_codon:yes stop_codon:yes gene_type:complete
MKPIGIIEEKKKKKSPAERGYKALDSLSRANKTMRDPQSKLSDARKAALSREEHMKNWQKARLEGPSRTPQKRSPALTMVMGPEKSGARWKNKKEKVNEGRKRLKRVGDAIAKKEGMYNGEELKPHFKKERHHEKEGDKRNTPKKMQKAREAALFAPTERNKKEYKERIKRKKELRESRTIKTAKKKLSDMRDLNDKEKAAMKKHFKKKPGKLESLANKLGSENVGRVYDS